MTSRDRILNFFRQHPGQFVSGQDISDQLNISRAAVWKQVKSLREIGFHIEAKHSAGYRLVDTPDLLLAADLKQNLDVRLIGRSILTFKEIDSTNTRARQLGHDGAEEGTVVIADRQLSGRGRMGRNWVSPAGVNLYCSILLRPQIPVQQAPQLTFLSAVSVAETLHEFCGLSAGVKWPNDVLVNGFKIAGLLNEMDAETELIRFVVLGMGINLNISAEQLPERQLYPATSVALLTGQPVDRLGFARALLQRFDGYYQEFLAQGFVPIRKRWEALCGILNQRVRVEQGTLTLEGTVVGLDSDGALRVQSEDGNIQRILTGDIRPL